MLECECFATLLKSNFGMGALLYICCISSKHLLVRTPLNGCFWNFMLIVLMKRPLYLFIYSFIYLFIYLAVIHALVFPPNISLGKLRNIPPEICSSFTGEHPCWSVISIKLLFNFVEITLQYGCSPVNLLHIVRTPFIRTPLESHFCKLKLTISPEE